MPDRHTPKTGSTPGYLFALASSAALSTTAILIRHLTVTFQIPALVLAFWRDVFVVLSLLPVLLIARPGLLKISRHDLLFFGFYGLILAGFNAFWTISVALNGAAVATVMAYSSTGFTVILCWWLFKERTGPGRLLAVFLCLAGCTMVAGAYDPNAWHANFAGITAGVFSGFSYAVYGLMGKSTARRGLSPWVTVLYTFTFATVFLGLINFLPGNIVTGSAGSIANMFWLGQAWEGWLVLLLLAAGPTLVGFGLYNLSLVYLSASVVNLIATTEPVFTAVAAYYLLGEHLNSIQLLGSAAILTGIILLRLFERHQPQICQSTPPEPN